MAAPHDASDGVAQLGALFQTSGDDDAPVIDPAATRRRRRRRGLIAGIASAVVVAVIAAYVGVVLTAPLPAPTIETRALHAPASPEPVAILTPPEGAWAISVSGGEQYLGPDAAGIWMTSGADEPRAIASISKLITALVILDAHPLAASDDPGPTLTFDKDDHALYDKYYVLGATIAKMPTGSTMSLRDVLKMMLIISACNYAEAATEWAFGSQSAFLAATRAWLAENGLAHTAIVEPTGIDARNVSTPSDLLALGRLALANPAIAEIVGMQSLGLPQLDGRSNTNTLLGDNGVSGIKTGTLDGVGSNLLFSARLEVGIGEPLEVVGVMLGGTSHDAVDREVSMWLSSIVGGFQSVAVGGADTQVGTLSTAWGDSARMMLASDASLRLWSDTPITVTVEQPTVTSAVEGEHVGSVTWSAGPASASVPVLLDATIGEPDAWWRLTHPAELFGG